MLKTELFETISVRVCDKKKSISASDCLKNQNSTRIVCHSKCRINEKSLSQLDYVTSPINENVFLKACPGSGKTEVVALKAAYELNNWSGVGGIAILSFTQNAARVIDNRVREFIGLNNIGYPHYIGTIDSWIHGYIAHPFSYRITNYKGDENDRSIKLIDCSSKSGFLNSFSTNYPFAKTGKILANQFCLDIKNDSVIFSSQDRVVDQARKKQFNGNEKWQQRSLIKELYELKQKFFEAGFATYQDMEYLSYKLILDREDIRISIAKRFPFIIVDECQDLSWIQLELLRNLKHSGCILHFIGDINQAIYKFKDVDPLVVLQFVSENDFLEKVLKINYRSNQIIVDLNQRIVSGVDVTGVENTPFKNNCICINYNNNLGELASWFEGELRRKSLDINNSAIVARGWSTVRKLRPGGRNDLMKIQEKLATAIYLWNGKNSDSKKEALLYMGEFVTKYFFIKSNTSKYNYYCPEVISSPLKWRVFLARVLDECIDSDKGILEFSDKWTNWAKKIKTNMHLILENHKLILNAPELNEFTQCKFIALKGKAGVAVIDSITSKFLGKGSSLRITTIHQVKGETLDAIMVVSAPDKRGATKDGHWSFWLEDDKSEKARLAYVASSRPKHLLIWAVPKISKAEIKQLSSLGFSIIDLPSQ